MIRMCGFFHTYQEAAPGLMTFGTASSRFSIYALTIFDYRVINMLQIRNRDLLGF
ncbi:hypothetical protein PaelaDRAFT_5915 [Paenibacillus lactis 154]|uniref:Uncharacterized protein n=1 Tax=Paenibacillus lactis 154 TaxID=743719 RepID=G4HPK4_9BACL|nr:hypothetical protein PaelaDRAFT_5915 [Paenibacillus lactis 154]